MAQPTRNPATNFSQPKISVITVVRNGRQYISQTITSVLEQTYDNVEYVVIDGGSTDGTVDIIRKHSHGITCWISEEDAGIADAFNKGLVRATGDYILFLNSDDALAERNVLCNAAQKIRENNFPMLLYGDCDILDRISGTALYRVAVDFSPTALNRGHMLPHQGLFAHRCYYEKYGNFDIHFRIAMDFEWLLRGALKERIIHIPLRISNVRDGGVSTRDRHLFVEEIIAALKKNNLICSFFDELKVRAYFIARSLGKTVLTSIGLYDAFCALRREKGGA